MERHVAQLVEWPKPISLISLSMPLVSVIRVSMSCTVSIPEFLFCFPLFCFVCCGL